MDSDLSRVSLGEITARLFDVVAGAKAAKSVKELSRDTKNFARSQDRVHSPSNHSSGGMLLYMLSI